jgi:prepilin-type N-terminal cleavage/methylation domain-containing protein
MKKQVGFTLIELAIVLVIIGLLLGGVLKGQELITQAKIKNVANDMAGVSVAIYGYQDRYKRLPGDDPGATRWAGATAGNGNNVIGVANTGYSSATAADENRLFWHHLRLAGFVAGDTSDAATAGVQPLNAANGITGVQSGGLGLSGTIICTGSLSAKIAQSLDSQMDDGNAITGSVRALIEGASPPTAVTAAVPTANYDDNGTNLYVLCKSI